MAHTTSTVSTAEYVRPGGGGVWGLLGVHLLIARKFVVGVLMEQALSPLLYLWSMGIGMGSLVNRNHSNALGVPYVAYIAPALIAATALQIGTTESMFPILAGFRWVKRYYAMHSTPLSPTQICLAQLAMTAIQLVSTCAIYVGIVFFFGGIKSVGALLSVPIAVFGAMAFATLISAYAATVDRESNFFNFVLRFMVIPMFLFSGTFYPISSLPAWARGIASISPLWHTTELCRAAALGPLHLSSGVGSMSMTALAVHVAYLGAMIALGTGLTIRNFTKRLGS